MIENNFRIFLKRAGAYLIDVVIVFGMGLIIASLPIFSKENNKYSEIYNNFDAFIDSHNAFETEVKDSFLDGEINQEEYEQLILTEEYQELIINNYDDNEISKEEYQDILDNLEQEYNRKAEVFNYQLKINL